MSHELVLRATGFIISLLLTLATYFIIQNPEIFNVSLKTVIITIFSLALIQASAQLFFFIDVWKEKGPLWNLAVFISTVSIIFIIIY